MRDDFHGTSRQAGGPAQRQASHPQGTAAAAAALLASANVAIIGKALEGTITSWNEGARRLYGYSAEEAVGQPVSIIVPEDRREELRSIMDRLRRGEAVGSLETVRLTRDGRRVHVSLTVSPVTDGKGRLVAASAVAIDASARVKMLRLERDARQAAEAANRRLFLLSRAGELLGSSLEVNETLGSLARLIVPELADWCAVDLVTKGGRMERVTVMHRDPARVRLAEELQRRYRAAPEASQGTAAVARTGQAELYRRSARS